MKRSIKLMAILPLFALVGCTDNGTKELSNSEVKTFVQGMKEEISKDSFSLPNKGTVISDITEVANGTSITITSETRFDKTEGSRYLYIEGKTSMGSSQTYYYEKDGKYYFASKGFGMDTSSEYATEEEFKANFDQYITTLGYDDATFKETIVGSLDSIIQIYDEIENPSLNSEGVTYDYDVKFTKFNGSSFKLEGTTVTSGSSIGDLTANTVIEFENYLPKLASAHTTGTYLGEEIDMTITQSYTLGSVDYVYPAA